MRCSCSCPLSPSRKARRQHVLLAPGKLKVAGIPHLRASDLELGPYPVQRGVGRFVIGIDFERAERFVRIYNPSGEFGIAAQRLQGCLMVLMGTRQLRPDRWHRFGRRDGPVQPKPLPNGNENWLPVFEKRLIGQHGARLAPRRRLRIEFMAQPDQRRILAGKSVSGGERGDHGEGVAVRKNEADACTPFPRGCHRTAAPGG